MIKCRTYQFLPKYLSSDSNRNLLLTYISSNNDLTVHERLILRLMVCQGLSPKEIINFKWSLVNVSQVQNLV